MFALSVEFLTGRYVATHAADPRASEWPPHPSRLLSALVATHFETPESEREAAELDALRWLASLPPPEIAASDASERDVCTVFVPVNDRAVVGNFDSAQTAVDEARSAADAAEDEARDAPAAVAKAARSRAAAARKSHEKKRAALDAAIRDRIAPGRVNESALEVAAALVELPRGAGRQPRTFPSVTPATPSVHFVWSTDDGAHFDRIDTLARRVVRLGHSSSLVTVRRIDSPRRANLVPDAAGSLVLRVPQAGQVDQLIAAHARHRETEPRVMPTAFVTYGPKKITPPARHTSPFGTDWLVFALEGGPKLPSTAVVDVTRALRGALLSHATDPRDPLLSGHRPNGRPLETPHVAFLALPFVGQYHADGGIRGVAVAFPRNASEAERRATLVAIDRWERSAAADAGEDSDEPGRVPAVRLMLGRRGTLRVRRLLEPADMKTLLPTEWSWPSRHWVTATPLVLDRFPGDLFAPDSARTRRARQEAAETIRRAVLALDMPAPSAVDLGGAPPMPGSAPAAAFPRFPVQADRPARVLVHARLTFEEPVAGPLILGAGRYHGLGLCRPISSVEVP